MDEHEEHEWENGGDSWANKGDNYIIWYQEQGFPRIWIVFPPFISHFSTKIFLSHTNFENSQKKIAHMDFVRSLDLVSDLWF